MAEDVGVSNVAAGIVARTVVQARTIHQSVLFSLAPERPVPRQLPARVRDFSGRLREAAALDALLPGAGSDAGSPLISLLQGTAGVGKTTLAVWWAHEVQHEFPDGTLFADLCGFGPSEPSAPGSVLSGFLSALGVAEDGIPAGVDSQSALYRSLLADRRVLVLLDNAVSAEQVRPLLPAAPGCLVLITSRAALQGLAVGHSVDRIAVDLLQADEAFGLVRRIIGEERANAERMAVTELTDICGRLPLALRIAATRVMSNRFFDVADVVKEIRRGLAALNTPRDERSAITAVFDWSYTRLPAAQARLFRLLGLHPTTEFGLPAAAVLADSTLEAASRLLEGLVEQHLVEQVGRQRYRLHDLLHAYAASHAEGDEPTSHSALARLLTWYALAADTADHLVFPGTVRLAIAVSSAAVPSPAANRAEALTWLEVEHTTLARAQRLAIGFGLVEAAQLFAGAARHLTLGPRAAWWDRLDAETKGLGATRSAGDRASEAFLLVRRGNTHRMLGDYEAANADFRSVLELAHDPARQYEALCGLGSDGRDRGRYEEALTYYEAALPVARQTGDLLAEAVVVCNLGQLNVALGLVDVGLEYSRRELALRREADDAVGVAYAQHNLAVAYQGLGDHVAAIELSEQVVGTYAAQGGAEAERATALETLSLSLARTGRTAEAVRCLREAVSVLTELGAPRAEQVRLRADKLAG